MNVNGSEYIVTFAVVLNAVGVDVSIPTKLFCMIILLVVLKNSELFRFTVSKYIVPFVFANVSFVNVAFVLFMKKFDLFTVISDKVRLCILSR